MSNKTYDDEQVSQIADVLAAMVGGGMTIEGAMASQSFVPKELLQLGRLKYEKRAGEIIEIEDPGVLVDDEVKKGAWYPGPRADDKFWPALRKYLESDLPEDVVDSVDQSSSKVIALGKPPGSNPIRSRGLVLGYVQSGKTTNFISVIAKAADVGYRLIVVLTGTTENLRTQTQERVDEYLVRTSGHAFNQLTTSEHDFAETTPSGAALEQKGLRSIAVVKKNPARLRRLRDWIIGAPKTTLNGLPILIIDDEADQASIDVGTKRRSTINQLIREILAMPKAAYVAYTATPFANLLIDTKTSDDLYPRDFIVDLPRPANYFGAEKIFGNPEATGEEGNSDDGLDLVRDISEEDVHDIRPPKGKSAIEAWVPEVPSSLRRALLWYLMATAARRHRSQKISHSSMLIHSSMSAVAHNRTAEAVHDALQDIRSELANNSKPILQECSDLWTSETERLRASEFGHVPVHFTEISEVLQETASSARIIVDNYLSTDRLYYPKSVPQTVIVIGGNTLSRGLTLEGLISSYFVRSASAYDTLLQMGRWFGYRMGYEDLVRIWMTAELQNWFLMLGIVEAEIRREIEVYEKEGKTPAQLPVRIRTHPQMSVTSAAKMKNALRTQVSYSGKRVQTILFKDKDPSWLKNNVDATADLFKRAKTAGHHEDELGNGRRGFKNVDADSVLKFLQDYSLHENAQSINKELIQKYIEKERANSSLDQWNVVLMEPEKGPHSVHSFGLNPPVRYMRRRKMYIEGQVGTANLKAIASRTDRVADLDIKIDAVRKTFGLGATDSPTDAQLMTIRSARKLGRVGLLCIYPIAQRSDPDLPEQEPGKPPVENRRTPLVAGDDVVGLCFMFPPSVSAEASVDYIAANVEPDYLEDVEAELEAADAYDEQHAKQEEALHG